MIMTEWEFIDNLSYRAQLSDEQANFVKLMYRTKLKKVRCPCALSRREVWH